MLRESASTVVSTRQHHGAACSHSPKPGLRKDSDRSADAAGCQRAEDRLGSVERISHREQFAGLQSGVRSHGRPR